MIVKHNPRLVAEVTKGMALRDVRRLKLWQRLDEIARQRALLLERIPHAPALAFRKGCRRDC
jgi:hypothetical protein